MAAAYEELDHCPTPQGDLILRRRRALSLDVSLCGAAVYEVTLDGEFLMSSLVDASERALATRALAEVEAEAVDVLVGGLGLGATAAAALESPGVRSVTVVEIMPAVVSWHERGLVPLAETLTGDPRCRFVRADFFAWVVSDRAPGGWNAVMVDIDHAPDSLLHPSHAEFYRAESLRGLAARMAPGGVFALWSADPPDEAFGGELEKAFARAWTREVEFFNPLVNETDRNTLYLAKRA